MSHQAVLERSVESRAEAAEYCRSVPVIGTRQSCLEVLRMFQADPEFPCIVIGEAGRPVGLIMRDTFYRHLAGRFAADLFYERPALEFAERAPLVFELSVPAADLLDAALNREGIQFYDCLIITQHGMVQGVLTVQDLMALSRALQRKAEEARRAAVAESRSRVMEIETSVEAASEASKRSLTESGRMTGLASAGREELETVKASFDRVVAMTGSQAKQVTELTERAEDISRVAARIRMLADQSGMLAMNASIEAAHAGEHGRGFAVVAAEVRKLAMQTKRMSDEIDQSVKLIAGLVNQTADTAVSTVREMEDSQKRVNKAGETFELLVESAYQTEMRGREVVISAEAAAKTTGLVREELSRLSAN
ncbi:methyl-accepting chemotaxis protein [Paenibacillus sp. DYY-L-2]|uniref:methyl-accepting chemotaxis protein n=1 Tax=Paenibacillus sp. DYY-L-2 TaxID=3447013 RepID=UPI003F4FB8BE